ncbi:ABC transporter ATP-binding protein [Candidatus Pacearchaeota archaeon]|nr:ABC transporter ATP-binding protein [Candidatus Pacearchaeota archaeon]
MGKKLINLQNVAKYYYMGEHVVKALDCINLEVEEGDFVAIIGPSGSGKSTAMNLTGSLDYSSKGEIYLENENIEDLTESELAQVRGKKIGFIFQQFNLIPNLTALENVALPMLFQEIEKEDRLEKAQEFLEMVDLGDRLDHYPNQLSGGQQQRVAIARALANDPSVILADEPTGNLDTKTGKKVMDFLTELNKKGKTVIMVTHDTELAREYAQKIYSVKDGLIEFLEKRKGNKWVREKNEC